MLGRASVGDLFLAWRVLVGTEYGEVPVMSHAVDGIHPLVGGDWNMTFMFPYIGNVIIN